MSYEAVDPSIDEWVIRHSLKLYKFSGRHDVRGVYVSSHSGECYQIWVGLPSNGQVMVNAACVEGPRDEDPEREWLFDVENIGDGLEEAFRTVIDWMAPSERYMYMGPLETK